jgi:selenocysteine-specific elongation factor
MLAGAGCIDAVMLVISAEEGVKPQTEEHLAICHLLGVGRGLTAVTKSDAVSSIRLQQVCEGVRRFLSGTFLNENNADIIPVSARAGQGMDKLRRALVSLTTKTLDRNPDMLPRLPLDRAFVMKGFGTVVTGTLLSGNLKTHETLAIEPGAATVRIRGIQAHGRVEEKAEAGSRIALNLVGIDAGEVRRGETLVAENTLGSCASIDVEATLLPGSAELKHRSRVRFHAFTSDTLAAVSLYGSQALEPESSRLMRLRLSKPVVLLPGDRFVLRQCSPAITIGGGRVLDAHPLANLRKAKCLAWLEELRDASVEQQLLLRVARRSVEGLALRALSAETGLTTEAIERMTEGLVRRNKLHRVPGDLLLADEAGAAAEGIVTRQMAVKAKHPGTGLQRSELKSQTGLRTEIFDFVLQRLARVRKLRVESGLVFPAGSDSVVPETDRKWLDAIAVIYQAAGLAPPSAPEVAEKLAIKEPEMRRLVTLLLRQKILVRLGSDALCVHQTALESLRVQMRELRAQTIDVARFKQLTGLSRKYAIPLLEHLDQERITRKQGDHRLVL